jgi:altronate hydrolase
MLSSSSSLLHLHPNDNVLVAKTALALGQDIPELGVRTRAQVPAGHKIAARRIAEGEQVKKYDTVIGVATRDLEPGDYVHSHNLKLVDYYRDPSFGADVRPVDYVPEESAPLSRGLCERAAAWARATSSASCPRSTARPP